MERTELVVMCLALASVVTFVVGILWPLYFRLAGLYGGLLI